MCVCVYLLSTRENDRSMLVQKDALLRGIGDVTFSEYRRFEVSGFAHHPCYERGGVPGSVVARNWVVVETQISTGESGAGFASPVSSVHRSIVFPTDSQLARSRTRVFWYSRSSGARRGKW